MTDERRLMAIHAHPDDEASKGAGMMAKYATAGRVKVVTATGGERGSILNPALAGDADILANMAQVRRAEMAAAVAALGVEHSWLGFVDSGLPEGDPLPPLPAGCFALEPFDDVVRALVREIREFRPQVVTTYDENGGYPHPDHIRVHTASIAAVTAARDPQAYPEEGEPWMVSKVYYDISFNAARMQTFHDTLLERVGHSPFADWLERRKGMPVTRASARIHVADFFAQRDGALRAHATQIDPKGFFFAMPRDIEAEVWPWEEFRLAMTNVGTARGVEQDLFERVPGVEPLV
ncbi:mycothiol conjugate amidase Mca [Trueperella bialowiezensis]|uniref:Mycothiol S-conjugate amidase n=1 Tax=Trueperella bialowiezensis TaxID=312285 RepID=A0A448PDK1_9ACTO|nr:mycothiol conjugate amidase Mca [Trueperella bialowiezensis]VEI12994.1 1D-myo-inositol 2-acetamido-2-deoxy-alpha-D-glucopyranoside deacetylase [Trueperella bialowiezensis]